MQYRKIVAIAMVGVLTASAGCAGILGSDSTNQATQTPVETQTPSDESTYPNGITNDRIEESQVFETHKAAVSKSSITAYQTANFTYGSQTQNLTVLTKKGGNGNILTKRGSPSTMTVMWSGGEKNYGKAADNRSKTNYFIQNTPPDQGTASRMHAIKGLLTDGEFTLSKTTTIDGETVHVLKTDTIKNEASFTESMIPAGNVVSYSATAYVTDSGIVEKIEYTIDFLSGKYEDTYSGFIQISDLGSTTVEKPSWISTAQEQAVQMDSGSDENATTLTHVRGESIQQESFIHIRTDSHTYTAMIPADVSQGDTLYFGVAGDGEGVVSVNSKPDGLQSVSIESVSITTDKSLVYFHQISSQG